MSRDSKVILTTMTMIYRDDGSFLVQDRLKNDWPGINFPGGHVEDEESVEEGAIREILEETGLIIDNLEEAGHMEWNLPTEKVRHLCILFRTNHYKGEIKESEEGPIFWVKKTDLPSYNLSLDFDKVLKIVSDGIEIK